MLALQQLRFMDALLAASPDEQIPALGIKPGLFAATERVAIYRNNLRGNFCRLLELEYPVTRRLVGEAFFEQTALQYLAASPSRSGDFFHAGREFATFLRRQFQESDYRYLPDVAELEWAYQEAMIAADDSRDFDIQGLLNLAPERLENLRFTLHPAVRLVRSPFPVVRVWQAHQGEVDDIDPIDLDCGGDNALLTRPGRSTTISAIDNGAAACLGLLLEGEPLGRALEAGLHAAADFNLQQALQQWLQNRALVTWSD